MTGRRPAFGRDEQVPFDSPQVEIPVEAGDEKNSIHVGGDDLLLGRIPGRAAGKAAAAWQDGDDPRVA